MMPPETAGTTAPRFSSPGLRRLDQFHFGAAFSATARFISESAEPIPRRLAVIGSGGAGKTTLARRISERLGIPHVELDALNWLENWTENPHFRAAVDEATSGETWVTCGGYRLLAMDLTLGRADTVVWLDYRLHRILWRLNRRIWVRGLNRKPLYNGNRERLWFHLFTRDSMYWRLLTTYRGKRRRNEKTLREFPHLRVVRARTPAETEAWFAGLPASPGA